MNSNSWKTIENFFTGRKNKNKIAEINKKQKFGHDILPDEKQRWLKNTSINKENSFSKKKTFPHDIN